MASQRKKSARPGSPDVELSVRVDAKEMRFGEVPETKVELFGDPGHESAHGSDRTNLPDKVREDETYRKVRVDYRLASRIVFEEEREEPG
ncbi:MAG: hypothetical protein M3433_07600 [Actinomycetota bacterium]|nr:hypothetical protein [Actinomycetota bacterium]MDQ3648433.1 hypothetical protein [Actinomycetota bacterium]